MLVERYPKIASATKALPRSTPPAPWNAERLRLATEAAGVALWSWAVDTDEITIDAHAFDLWGMARTDVVSFAVLFERIYPADRDDVSSAFLAARTLPGTYQIDFRIMVEDKVRWIACRGHGDDACVSGRTMFGVFFDATARKSEEQANELVAGEMSHRVKNLLAIAAGLTAITSRSCETTEEMAQQMTVRLTALGRAHDLVRPICDRSGSAALLIDLLRILLAPYDDLAGSASMTRVSAPRLLIGEKTTTVLALIVHELATNSLKYGAFSVASGVLDVSCQAHGDDVVLVWSESGVPNVRKSAGPEGYGTKLVDRSVSGHLGGTISRKWRPDGFVATLRMKSDRLSA